MAKLSIASHTAKHEQCLKILEMISRNNTYMESHIKESRNPFWTDMHGKSHYAALIALRGKIHNRLTCYYAKKIAMIGSEAYEVALAIREPKQSSI